MIQLARLNDVTLDLYWEKKMVGKVVVAEKRGSNLAGGVNSLTQNLGEDLAETSLTGKGKDITPLKPVVGNTTHLSSLNASAILSVTPSFSVSFESIADAGKVDRNDLFLAFYAALLHVAQFSTESEMQSFHSDSPSEKLHLHVQEIGIGCQVSRE